MADTSEAAEWAQRYKQPQYHRTFTLPATGDHGELQIGYSDLGRQPTPESEQPVILLMPGMQASRVLGDFWGIVGEKLGVRIITADRFGIGLSSAVGIHQRISTWVELVPKLLAHLNIKQVSLVSHSAGTVYLLNTLYSCREVLAHPPHAVLLGTTALRASPISANVAGPWVDVKHSGVTLMKAANILPSGTYGALDTLARTVATTIGPAIGSSLSFAFKWLPSEPVPESENRARWKSEYGLSAGTLDVMENAAMEVMYGESLAGMNDEARLCVRKNGCTWDACDDYEEFVKELARDSVGKPRVRIYFAEEDALIGDNGKKYVDKCWSGVEGVEYTSTTVPGSDHDSLVTTASVLEEIIREVADYGSLE